MIGFLLNPSPPKASQIIAGRFGGFLQVVFDDSRLMTSQESVPSVSFMYPPQISSLEKPIIEKND